jgi:hypothetical protein
MRANDCIELVMDARAIAVRTRSGVKQRSIADRSLIANSLGCYAKPVRHLKTASRLLTSILPRRLVGVHPVTKETNMLRTLVVAATTFAMLCPAFANHPT